MCRDKDPRIADIFVQKGAFLKLYSNYIMEFDQKCRLFDEARRKYPEFDTVTTAFEVNPVYVLKPRLKKVKLSVCIAFSNVCCCM